MWQVLDTVLAKWSWFNAAARLSGCALLTAASGSGTLSRQHRDREGWRVKGGRERSAECEKNCEILLKCCVNVPIN